MKNAVAFVHMEGYCVAPEVRMQCVRVLRGKTTTAEILVLSTDPLSYCLADDATALTVRVEQ